MPVPESDVPCIFVGPGTGIAPMRAMIQERVIARGHHAKGSNTPYQLTIAADNTLVFGNRNRAKDFLYEDEWTKFTNKNELTLFTAFSRDGPADEKKTYVQDIIAREQNLLYDTLIRRSGALFISGSSGKMPQGVKESVIEIIEKEEGISREEAVIKQAQLEKSGRWHQET